MLLKPNKQVIRLLNLNYGIGFYRSRLLLKYCGVNLNFDLTIRRYERWKFEKKIKIILKEKSWIIFDDLRQRRQDYFFFIKKLFNFYKFLRLRNGLPLRGQRTHSNRQTISRMAKLFLYNEAEDQILKKKKKLFSKRRKQKRGFFNTKQFLNKKQKKRKLYRLNFKS